MKCDCCGKELRTDGTFTEYIINKYRKNLPYDPFLDKEEYIICVECDFKDFIKFMQETTLKMED